VPVQQGADGRGGLAERVGPVDGGCHLAGLDELADGDQVFGVLRRDEGAELLVDERRQQLRPELTVNATEPASVGLASDDDEPSPRSECAAEARQPTVASDVEDDVVAVPAVSEVFSV
jgi:hypothetical protein